MTREEKIICKDFLNDADKTHSCNEYKLLMALLEQEPVINKIRAEIEQTVSRYSISRERSGMGQVEWSDRLIKESEVLQILDKYNAESEESSNG